MHLKIIRSLHSGLLGLNLVLKEAYLINEDCPESEFIYKVTDLAVIFKCPIFKNKVKRHTMKQENTGYSREHTFFVCLSQYCL